MFSMSPVALAAPLARDLLRHTLPEFEARAKTLPLGLQEINDALPEGGLPRGGVVELAAPRGLGRSTSIALSACAAAQAEARLRGTSATSGAWCAWIDPSGSLFAPAVARAGVDLSRLLVVRPPPEMLAKVAIRMALSRAFSVLVVDVAGVPGAFGQAGGKGEHRGPPVGRREEDLARWVNVVRKLALAIEGSDAAILLLTDRQAARPMPLPVAMRLELEQVAEGRLMVRVAKDRRGRVTSPTPVVLGRRSRAERAAGSEPRPALSRA
ncbi:recombinase A [Sorangium sp. So ce1036]|uniref:recombinase A n=1 Tax=Sorangium sp. So ce1036 TaxID=3133328 RepID=UPI003F0809AA